MLLIRIFLNVFMDTEKRNKLIKLAFFVFALFVASNVADAALTYYAVNTGYFHEVNILPAFLMSLLGLGAGIIIVKSFSIFIGYLFLRAIRESPDDRVRKLASYGISISTSLICVIVAYQIVIISKVL